MGPRVSVVNATVQQVGRHVQFFQDRKDRRLVVLFDGVGELQQDTETSGALQQGALHFFIGRRIGKDGFERGADEGVHTADEADHKGLRGQVVVGAAHHAGDELEELGTVACVLEQRGALRRHSHLGAGVEHQHQPFLDVTHANPDDGVADVQNFLAAELRVRIDKAEQVLRDVAVFREAVAELV